MLYTAAMRVSIDGCIFSSPSSFYYQNVSKQLNSILNITTLKGLITCVSFCSPICAPFLDIRTLFEKYVVFVFS